MTLAQQRIAVLLLFITLLGVIAWSYFHNGLVGQLLGGEKSNAARLQILREYFQAWGSAAPLMYAAMVVVEVVLAPIPGTLLYLPGGAIFGGFVGGLMALIGNVLGAGIACQLSRLMVQTRQRQQSDKMQKYIDLIEKRGFWIVLLLRLNPLTSSDLVSYAAGVTPLPITKVMLATAIGMAPLCFTQSYLSRSLFELFPALIWGLVGLCGLYAAILTIWLIKAGRDTVKLPPVKPDV